MEQCKRLEREQRASRTIARDVPDLLRTSPRAQSGISRTELIVDPAPYREANPNATIFPRTDFRIRLQPVDALQAADHFSARPFQHRQTPPGRRRSSTKSLPNVAIHSMASLARPGGGFLTGANGQEEFLCTRTTLFASLSNDFYPLPELGGIYTPDVLVFRNTAGMDLSKRDRYFVDVITAGVARHLGDRGGRSDELDAGCTCGVSYCDRDRDMMVRKMKAVLRIAQMKGHRELIIGDWGCGPLRHPVREVAKLWRKVLVGGSRQRRPNTEQWEGLQEVIFAIPNCERAQEFRAAFADVLAPDYPDHSDGSSDEEEYLDDRTSQLMAKAASLELQLDLAKSSALRNRLREELAIVMRDIAQSRAVRHDRTETVSEEEDADDGEEGYVMGGFAGSDGEDESFYPLDATTSDSDSSGRQSEPYEFRFGADNSRYTTDPHPSDDEDDSFDWHGCQPSPKMLPDGWFAGSIDELSAHLHGGRAASLKGPTSISPRSPLVRCQSSSTDDADLFDDLLVRFQRTGMS